MIKSCNICKRKGGEEYESSSSEVSNEDNEDVEQPRLPTRRVRRHSRNRQRYRERSRELHRYINFVNTVNQQFPLGATNVINPKSAVTHNAITLTQTEQTALLPPPIQPLQVSMNQNSQAIQDKSQLPTVPDSECHPIEETQTTTPNGQHIHSDEINTESASKNSTMPDVDLIPKQSEPFDSIMETSKVSDVYPDNEGKIHHETSNNSLHLYSLEN